MRSLLPSVSALILSLSILLAGNSLQFVILGLRAETEGFPLWVVGAMTAGYYTGYAVGSLLAPRVVAALGHIRAFAALSSVISGVVLAHALWVDPPFWVALRVVTGLCFAGLATVSESWLNAKATRDLRARLLAIASICAITGYAVGPALTALGSVSGYVLFVIASILMSVALVPVTITRFAAPSAGGAAPGEGYSLLRLFRETPLGLVGCLVTGAAQGSFLGLGAVFANRLGLGDTGASFFVTVALASGALAQYPLGVLADRFDRRRVICGIGFVVGGAALAVAAALMAVGLEPAAGPFGGGIPQALIVAAAVVGGVAAMPIYPVVIAYANDRLTESSIVPAAATLILTFSIGSAISGPVASAAMDSLGPGGLYVVSGAVLVALGAMAVLRMIRGDAWTPAADGDGVFVTSPGFAPVDLVIDEAQLSFDFDAPRAPGT